MLSISHIIFWGYGIIQYQFIIVLIFVFLIAAITFLSATLISRWRKRILALRNDLLSAECNKITNKLLFEDEEILISDNDVNIYKLPLIFAKNRYNRQYLIDCIIKLHKMLEGNDAEKLREYYYNSGLVETSIKKLGAFTGGETIQGIAELNEMKVREAVDILAKYLKKGGFNDSITQARLAIVNIDTQRGFEIILENDNFQSEWDQLLLISLMERKQFEGIPSVKEFMHKNPSLQVLGIRLASEAKVFEDIPYLIMLAKSESDYVKLEAIKALGNLEADEAVSYLISMYPSQETEVKIAILEALTKIKDPDTLPFLKDAAIDENYEVRLSALKAITKLDKTQIVTKQLLLLNSPEIAKGIAHVNDDRI